VADCPFCPRAAISARFACMNALLARENTQRGAANRLAQANENATPK